MKSVGALEELQKLTDDEIKKMEEMKGQRERSDEPQVYCSRLQARGGAPLLST